MSGQLHWLDSFVDVFGDIGYARGFALFVLLSVVCAVISFGLRTRARVQPGHHA
ncbi:MAG: hypothetical protein KY466_16075 [Gemmatimonadetes bacterium]|nr:hypothetical protein [Gemmatimonadota bacterium]